MEDARAVALPHFAGVADVDLRIAGRNRRVELESQEIAAPRDGSGLPGFAAGRRRRLCDVDLRGVEPESRHGLAHRGLDDDRSAEGILRGIEIEGRLITYRRDVLHFGEAQLRLGRQEKRGQRQRCHDPETLRVRHLSVYLTPLVSTPCSTPLLLGRTAAPRASPWTRSTLLRPSTAAGKRPAPQPLLRPYYSSPLPMSCGLATPCNLATPRALLRPVPCYTPRPATPSACYAPRLATPSACYAPQP